MIATPPIGTRASSRHGPATEPSHKRRPGAPRASPSLCARPGHTAALRGGVSPVATVRLLSVGGPATDPEADRQLRRALPGVASAEARSSPTLRNGPPPDPPRG